MNILLDEDNKIIFKNLLLGNIIIIFLAMSLAYISIMLSPKILLLLIMALAVICYGVLITCLKMGLNQFNNKYQYTRKKILFRHVIVSNVLIEMVLFVMLLIPLFGQFLYIYMVPTITDNFLIKSIRQGKQNFGFTTLGLSYKHHRKFSWRYMVISILYTLASLGVCGVWYYIFGQLNGNEWPHEIIIVSLTFILLLIAIMDAYIKAILYTNLLKNLSPLKDKELEAAEKY